MCLITKNVKPKVATKDIVCYKNLEWNEEFQFWETPYTYTRVDDAVIKGKKPLKAVGEKSHVIVERDSSDYSPTFSDGNTYYKIEGGYIHVYSKKRQADRIANIFGDKTFRAIIPKGTKYYVDYSDNEFCAEEIMILPNNKQLCV